MCCTWTGRATAVCAWRHLLAERERHDRKTPPWSDEAGQHSHSKSLRIRWEPERRKSLGRAVKPAWRASWHGGAVCEWSLRGRRALVGGEACRCKLIAPSRVATPALLHRPRRVWTLSTSCSRPGPNPGNGSSLCCHPYGVSQGQARAPGSPCPHAPGDVGRSSESREPDLRRRQRGTGGRRHRLPAAHRTGG